MLDHVSIGVTDIVTARRFYDSVLAPLGYKCLSADSDAIGYGRDSIALWILKIPQSTVQEERRGLHFCLQAPSRHSVDAFHRKALAVGGFDNGRPGVRADYGPDYYAAFVVDPDGYRLEAYCGAPAASD